jgi:arylsulfatase A-like enzyme
MNIKLFRIKNIGFIFLFFLSNILNAQSPPNFVIIVLDDQGWTGSSLQMDALITDSKSDFFITPAIESLADKGMVFSQGYAPAPKCSPSRASILTGKTPARNNFTNTDNAIAVDKMLIEPSINTTLNGSEITYAEWLKTTGLNYRTAHFGKWHQGNSTASSPASNGFDFTDGSTNNNSGNQGGTVQEDPKKIFELTTKSIEFIENAVNDGVPFALQLSHYSVHEDVEARQTTIDLYSDASKRPLGTRHNNIEYAAMTQDTDDGIGLLLTEITNLGLDNNTYVIFISDNGAQLNQSDNSPLAYGKTFITEGGIRVPFIIKGPNIAEKSRSSEAIVGYDLFPTIAELTGSAVNLPVDIDGQSLVPLLTGGSFTRVKPIYFHSPHYEGNKSKKPRSALVDGSNKLMVDYESGEIWLFDLDSDIGETNDLSATLQTLTRTYTIQLRNYLKEVNASMPTLDPSHANFSGNGADVDNDGLDDVWELKELLTYAYGPNDDPDNDNKTNLEEYTNNTDPYVNESALFVENFNDLDSAINVYPNPVKKNLSISLNTTFDTSLISKIRIYASDSKLVFSSNRFEEKINVESFAKGVYYIKINTSKDQFIKKLIIN